MSVHMSNKPMQLKVQKRIDPFFNKYMEVKK
jgi:hypothetical protein